MIRDDHSGAAGGTASVDSCNQPGSGFPRWLERGGTAPAELYRGPPWERRACLPPYIDASFTGRAHSLRRLPGVQPADEQVLSRLRTGAVGAVLRLPHAERRHREVLRGLRGESLRLAPEPTGTSQRGSGNRAKVRGGMAIRRGPCRVAADRCAGGFPARRVHRSRPRANHAMPCRAQGVAGSRRDGRENGP